MQNDMQLYVNKSQCGKTREGTLLRVKYNNPADFSYARSRGNY